MVQKLLEKGGDLLAVNSDGDMPHDLCDDEACVDVSLLEEKLLAQLPSNREYITDYRERTETATHYQRGD